MPDPSPWFAHHFAPLGIGGVKVQNLILSTGRDTSMAHGGRVTEAMIACHQARAKGGAGLIVSYVVGVHETARYTSHVLMGIDDGCLPEFRRLSDAVHTHGTRIFAQLFHQGLEIIEVTDGTAPGAWSAPATPRTGST